MMHQYWNCFDCAVHRFFFGEQRMEAIIVNRKRQEMTFVFVDRMIPAAGALLR